MWMDLFFTARRVFFGAILMAASNYYDDLPYVP